MPSYNLKVLLERKKEKIDIGDIYKALTDFELFLVFDPSSVLMLP